MLLGKIAPLHEYDGYVDGVEQLFGMHERVWLEAFDVYFEYGALVLLVLFILGKISENVVEPDGFH